MATKKEEFSKLFGPCVHLKSLSKGMEGENRSERVSNSNIMTIMVGESERECVCERDSEIEREREREREREKEREREREREIGWV